jgi:hypothetical protein
MVQASSSPERTSSISDMIILPCFIFCGVYFAIHDLNPDQHPQAQFNPRIQILNTVFYVQFHVYLFYTAYIRI